jgi:hypothetical protein
LTDVISIDGAEHSILANGVLPFGYTRMAAQTVAEYAPDRVDNRS